MNNNPVKMDDDVKKHLSDLLSAVDPVISETLSNMTAPELKHAMDTMSHYLKLDLKYYFNREIQSRSKNIEDFDDMFTRVTK